MMDASADPRRGYLPVFLICRKQFRLKRDLYFTPRPFSAITNRRQSLQKGAFSNVPFPLSARKGFRDSILPKFVLRKRIIGVASRLAEIVFLEKLFQCALLSWRE